MTSRDTPHDDSILITRACDGDQVACEMLYRRYVRMLYRLSIGILLNEQDAEEVVQDSFAYAFQNLHRYDSSRSAFRTWLYTITISRCRNKRRRKWLPTTQLSEIVERLPGRDPQPERVAERRGDHETLQRALANLSPKLREAIVLRYFDGLTYREMAEVLDCPRKTAESRVRLAHEALYKLLESQRELLLDGMFRHEQAR